MSAFDTETQNALAHLKALLPHDPSSLQPLRYIYGEVQRQAGMLSYIDAFWLMGVLTLLVLPLAFLLRQSHGRGNAPVGH